MQEMTVGNDTAQPRISKILFTAVCLLALAVVGFLAYRVLASSQSSAAPAGYAPISQVILKEQYGVQINLIGVTAAGGMVDLRLKILDAAKAKPLLQGQPLALLVEDSGVILTAPAESQEQETNLKDGGLFYMFFSNAQNAVEPGDRVSILFGNTRLESITVK